MSNKQQVNGLSLSAHRNAFSYFGVGQVPLSIVHPYSALDQAIQSWESAHGSSTLPLATIKKIILTWMIMGHGSEVIEEDSGQRQLFEDFQRLLGSCLPPAIQFKRFRVSRMEIVLETTHGERFILDAASGGLAAIIEYCWALFLLTRSKSGRSVFVVDELENHLHPAAQRELLPSLVRSFPQVQFIVATHSPLIVGSVEDCSVYALRFNKESRIVSELLDLQRRCGSASETLQEALGTPFTMPVWIEDKLDRIIAKYKDSGLDKSNLEDFKRDLEDASLADVFPQAVTRLIENDQTD